jgi:hypothetical protein
LSRSIADSLRVTLTPKEDRDLAARPAPNAYAFDTYLRTRRDIWSFVPERMERAKAELTHALKVVGDDPFLHAGLALVNWQYINGGVSGDREYLVRPNDTRGWSSRSIPRAPMVHASWASSVRRAGTSRAGCGI